MKRTKLSILLIVFTSAACLFVCHAADWPTFRGNQERTGYYPDPAGYPSSAPLWTISLGSEIISSPSVEGNVLYIGGRDSCIHAIDCGTGNILWKRKTGGWVDASPLISGGRVIAGSRDSTIYALDKATGEVLSTWAAGLQMSSAALTADGRLLSGLGLPNGGIGVYDLGAGRLAKAAAKWSVAIPQYTYSSPAIHGQAAVIGATDGKLYGIDTGDKDTIWSLATGGGVYLSTPAIDDTTVYFAPGDDDRNVYAVNLLSGRIIWKSHGFSPVADTVAAQTVLAKKLGVRLLSAVDRGRLARLSPADRKKAISTLRQSGIELPRVRIADAGGLSKTTAGIQSDFIPLQGIRTSSAAVGAKNVFVIQKELGYLLTNDSLVQDKQRFTLQALNKKTGAPAWSFSEVRSYSRLGYCSSPVVTENTVFFGWGEGRLYGLDAESGKIMWQDSLQGHVVSSPAIALGKLYVATMDGHVYAYNLANTAPGLDFATSTYCYPNPARDGVSHIQVYVAASARLDIAIYTMADAPVLRTGASLTPGTKYTFDWNVKGVANGVYFADVKATYADGKKDKKVLKIAVLR
jgi:outer membrane protein assembly factor BamB